MKHIAHRGNWSGKQLNYENKPEYIETAIGRGYDAEIDLWVMSDALFLGHDTPTYSINQSYLENLRDYLWIHAKNITAVEWLSKTNLHWFWHDNDKITITSNGCIWTYPEVFVSNSVINQPDDNSIFWTEKLWEKTQYIGICHDDLTVCETKFKKL
jgi:hypothetical protein